jgi:hypothetical protein
MVYKNSAVGLVLETAGPTWHLVGTITRTNLNQLTLARTVDSLTPKINAAMGQLLPAVQLTDPSGTSANITMVKMSLQGPTMSDPWLAMSVATQQTIIFNYNILTPLSKSGQLVAPSATSTTTTTTGPTSSDDWTTPV